MFEAKTDDAEDLAFLKELLTTSPRFRAEYPMQKGMEFSGMYSPCVQGTLCVKIDDDVVSWSTPGVIQIIFAVYLSCIASYH